MARYITRARLNASGLAGLVREPTDREEALRPLIEEAGGTLEAYYFSPESMEVITITEAPDEWERYDSLLLAIMASGAVDVATVEVNRVISAQELAAAAAGAGSASYRPPGG